MSVLSMSAMVRGIATVLGDPESPPRVVRDLADDYLVALARAADADAIVTGDRDLPITRASNRRRSPLTTHAHRSACSTDSEGPLTATPCCSQRLSPALAGIIGGLRAWTASMISALSIPWR